MAYQNINSFASKVSRR